MTFPNLRSPAARTALASLILAFTLFPQALSARAQTAPEPRREQLLNGLPILLWYRPGDQRVLLKLRVHSGAAFDLAGKAGTMALLGDALFPDAATREYFTEELGGRLEVTTDYDSINVTLSGPASDFERILSTLQSGLVNTQLSADVVNRLREARAKVLRETAVSPVTLADRAVMSRLFGSFPYGRPAGGSAETLARVDRGELMLARDRFLSPNNATLAIVGGVEERRALRALRQILGAWRKSDSTSPSTFRQPEAPDPRTLLLDLPGTEAAEVRLAVRGLARPDRDYAAASLLALLARDRWQAAAPELGKSPFFVRQEAHVLPGVFVMGASVKPAEAAKILAAARQALQSLAAAPVTQAELDRVRQEALALFIKQTEQPETFVNAWLDAETFKLAAPGEQGRALSAVTPADAQRVASRLFRDAHAASVVLGSAAVLRAELERAGKIEVAGQTPTPKPSPEAKPAAKTPATTPPADKPKKP